MADKDEKEGGGETSPTVEAMSQALSASLKTALDSFMTNLDTRLACLNPLPTDNPASSSVTATPPPAPPSTVLTGTSSVTITSAANQGSLQGGYARQISHH